MSRFVQVTDSMHFVNADMVKAVVPMPGNYARIEFMDGTTASMPKEKVIRFRETEKIVQLVPIERLYALFRSPEDRRARHYAVHFMALTEKGRVRALDIRGNKPCFFDEEEGFLGLGFMEQMAGQVKEVYL